MTRAFQNVATAAVSVDFKCSGRKIETQRQLWTCEELFDQKIAFSGCVPGIVSASPSRVWTARTAYSAVVFKRPPKGAGQAQQLAKALRADKGDICRSQPTSAIATDNRLFGIFCDLVMRSNPGHKFRCHKIGEFRIRYEI